MLLYYIAIFCFVGYKAVPETLVSSCVAFSLPPYVDDSDWAMAAACVHHGEDVARASQMTKVGLGDMESASELASQEGVQLEGTAPAAE